MRHAAVHLDRETLVLCSETVVVDVTARSSAFCSALFHMPLHVTSPRCVECELAPGAGMELRPVDPV